MCAQCRRFLALSTIASFLGALPPSSAMDVVRVETRTDEAVAKYGVSGTGVVVAILDRGIDWSHPDFISPDGTTRVKWLLDQTGQNLCPGNPPAVQYSEAQINVALLGGPAINSRDAFGHGTVTTGIAAGNGRAFADDRYRGLAPGADLIIVKVVSEGAPAHGSEPAETPFQGCIEEALNWLDVKLNALGHPCVALINSGVQWGPIDGTSAVSRKIDQVFGEDRPGRAYVAASGDEGNLPNHAGGTFDSLSDTVVRWTKNTTATTYLQMWYSGTRPARITFASDDGTTVGPVSPGSSLNQSGVYIVQYNPGQEFYPWRSTSGDRAVWISVTGHSGGGSITIRGTTTGPGTFDLYSPDFTNAMPLNDHLVPGTLTDYASTHSAIVAGAHVARNAYTDINGFVQFVNGEGSMGELWDHSSAGPTRDGRVHGVDVTAPGHNCFAAYAPRSYWAEFTWNLIHDGGGWYGRGGATSGSAPIVVGAVALMLDKCPRMTARQARQILHDTAVSDSNTGATPNPEWGYGKLDVLAALDEVHAFCVGDGNGDGHRDLADHRTGAQCLRGPEYQLAGGNDCRDTFDFDLDSDVDLADWGEFQRVFAPLE